MPDVRLDFYDLDIAELPDVCMRCGEPATVQPVKSFSWMPAHARFLPPIISVWFIKRRRAPIPLCDQHKNHWSMRYLIGLGGLAMLLLLGVVGWILCDMGDDRDPWLSTLGMAVLGVDGLLFIGWLTTIIILGFTQINAVEITNDTITLKNVHAAFRKAYRDMRRGEFMDDPPDDRYRQA